VLDSGGPALEDSRSRFGARPHPGGTWAPWIAFEARQRTSGTFSVQSSSLP
jgi:hypothetical protein